MKDEKSTLTMMDYLLEQRRSLIAHDKKLEGLGDMGIEAREALDKQIIEIEAKIIKLQILKLQDAISKKMEAEDGNE